MANSEGGTLRPASENLTTAFLDAFNSPLTEIAPRFDEIQEDQINWLQKLQTQNEVLDGIDGELAQITSLFSKIPEYRNKMTLLQRDMAMLGIKASELDARAAALVDARKRQDEREAQLQAKPAPISSSGDKIEEKKS